MLTIKIINYLETQSKGLIKISLQDAQHIINLVSNHSKQPVAHAKLSRVGLNGKLDLQRIITTTNEAINTAVLQALETGPAHGFYVYELFNDAQEFQGKIFTINPNIFD